MGKTKKEKEKEVELFNITKDEIDILMSQTVQLSIALYKYYDFLIYPKNLDVVIKCFILSSKPYLEDYKSIAISDKYCRLILKYGDYSKHDRKKLISNIEKYADDLGFKFHSDENIVKFIECILRLLNKLPPFTDIKLTVFEPVSCLIEFDSTKIHELQKPIYYNDITDEYYWTGNGKKEKIPASVANEYL